MKNTIIQQGIEFVLGLDKNSEKQMRSKLEEIISKDYEIDFNTEDAKKDIQEFIKAFQTIFNAAGNNSIDWNKLLLTPARDAFAELKNIIQTQFYDVWGSVAKGAPGGIDIGNVVNPSALNKERKAIEEELKTLQKREKLLKRGHAAANYTNDTFLDKETYKQDRIDDGLTNNEKRIHSYKFKSDNTIGIKQEVTQAQNDIMDLTAEVEQMISQGKIDESYNETLYRAMDKLATLYEMRESLSKSDNHELQSIAKKQLSNENIEGLTWFQDELKSPFGESTYDSIQDAINGLIGNESKTLKGDIQSRVARLKEIELELNNIESQANKTVVSLEEVDRAVNSRRNKSGGINKVQIKQAQDAIGGNIKTDKDHSIKAYYKAYEDAKGEDFVERYKALLNFLSAYNKYVDSLSEEEKASNKVVSTYGEHFKELSQYADVARESLQKFIDTANNTDAKRIYNRASNSNQDDKPSINNTSGKMIGGNEADSRKTGGILDNPLFSDFFKKQTEESQQTATNEGEITTELEKQNKLLLYRRVENKFDPTKISGYSSDNISNAQEALEFGFGGFGDGLYAVVANAAKDLEVGKDSASYYEFDASNYNLYINKTVEQAEALKRFLLSLQKLVSAGSILDTSTLDHIEDLDEQQLFAQAQTLFKDFGMSAEQFSTWITNAKNEAKAMTPLIKTGIMPSNYHNFGTRFMQTLGYEGVLNDTGDLDYDGNYQGSVIYEPKVEEIKAYIDETQHVFNNTEEFLKYLATLNVPGVDNSNYDSSKLIDNQDQASLIQNKNDVGSQLQYTSQEEAAILEKENGTLEEELRLVNEKLEAERIISEEKERQARIAEEARIKAEEEARLATEKAEAEARAREEAERQAQININKGNVDNLNATDNNVIPSEGAKVSINAEELKGVLENVIYNVKDVSENEIKTLKDEEQTVEHQKQIEQKQREAEVVKQLINLYKQLGEAQARGDINEVSRIRGDIKIQRDNSSIDYATDMKLKDALKKGFESENSKIIKAKDIENLKKQNEALKEQENIINNLDKAYKEYGALKESAGINSGTALGNQLEDETQDKLKEIQTMRQELQTMLSGNISSELNDKFDKSQKAGQKAEADKAYRAMAKKDDADEETRKKKILSLEKEIAKIRAEIDETSNTGVKETLEKEIELREELIKLQKQGQSMDEVDEAYQRKRLSLNTKQAKKEAATNARETNKAFEDAIKESRNRARVNEAGSVLKKGTDVLSSTWRMDNISESDISNLSEIQKLQDALKELDALKQKIDDDGIVNPQDAPELQNLTHEVLKQSKAVQGLINNYERFNDENSTSLGKTLSGDNVKQQLIDAANAAHDGQIQIQSYDETTQELTYTVKTGAHEFTEFTAGVRYGDKALREIQGTTKRTESFLDAIKRKTKEISTYLLGSASIGRVIGELKKGVTYVREIDSALTELKKVTDKTEESYDRFLQTAGKTAGKVGSTIKEIVSSTADWARLGYSMEQAANLAETTSVLLNVSEFQSIDQATSALVSTMQAFGYAAEDSMHVVDVMNEIGKLLPKDNYIG